MPPKSSPLCDVCDLGLAGTAIAAGGASRSIESNVATGGVGAAGSTRSSSADLDTSFDELFSDKPGATSADMSGATSGASFVFENNPNDRLKRS